MTNKPAPSIEFERSPTDYFDYATQVILEKHGQDGKFIAANRAYVEASIQTLADIAAREAHTTRICRRLDAITRALSFLEGAVSRKRG